MANQTSAGQTVVPAPATEITIGRPASRKRQIDEVEPSDRETSTDRTVHQRKRSRETDPQDIAGAGSGSSPSSTPIDTAEPEDEDITDVDDIADTIEPDDEEIVDITDGTVDAAEPDDEEIVNAADASTREESPVVASQTSSPVEEAVLSRPAADADDDVQTESTRVEKESTPTSDNTKPVSPSPENDSARSFTTTGDESAKATEAAQPVQSTAAKSEPAIMAAAPVAASPFASVMSGSGGNNFFLRPAQPAGQAAVSSSPFASLNGPATSAAPSVGSSGLAWGFSAPVAAEPDKDVGRQAGFKPPKPFGAPDSDDEADADDNTSQQGDSEDEAFRSEAKRAGDILHTTGEESEETLFQLEAKFYVLTKDGSQKMWVERGNGIVKLNREAVHDGATAEDDAESRSADPGENADENEPEIESQKDEADSANDDPDKETKPTDTDTDEGDKDETAKSSDDESDGPEGSTAGSDQSPEAKPKKSAEPDEPAQETKKTTGTAARARLLMRSHKGFHIALNCPLNKALRYGDPNGLQPAGTLFYFTWPHGAGYDMCLLKAAQPGEAAELWESVQDVLGKI